MKQLIIADLHIKLNQKNVPIDWAKNRYNEFIGKISELTEQVDKCLILGDTFDRIPTLEELNVYFDLVSNLNCETYFIDGNHEASKKGKTFLSLLAPITTAMNHRVTVVTDIKEYSWGSLLPYCKLKEKGIFDTLNKTKPLYTHVRGEIPPHVKPEIDLELLKDFPIVYAGDLHSHSNSQANIVYPGSPMTTSFHRSEVDTGYIIADGVNYSWHSFNLPQLIRKTVQNPNDMIPTSPDHTIYELEGDIGELSSVKNSDLLDKKLVKRSSESSLILTKQMTVEQELYEYLVYILEIPENVAEELVGEFHDYI